jgi:hypothetical protein
MAPAGGAMAGPHDSLIAKHSAAHGVPEPLIRRVIHIESRGNPRVVSKGNYGLMQIRLGTAKAMGYRGTADGLLDADTNMTYAVKYLASAYRAAGCNEQRAINYYQRGFYKRPTSKCALPRSTTTQVANVEPAQRAAAQRSVTGSDATPASADLLQPRVVQVQTITRPKSAVQSSAVQSSAAVPPSTAPVQVAAAPVSAPVVAAAKPAAPAPVVAAPVAAPAPVVVQPAAPQTVARAPEQDLAPPPQSSPALPTVFMELLPMPKPRPAGAPQTVAKLDAAAVTAPASQTDASRTQSDTQVAKLDSAVVPLPQPRPESKAETEAAPERESKPARRAQQRHTHTRVSRKKPEESGLVTFLKKLTTPEKPARSRRASRTSASWLPTGN